MLKKKAGLGINVWIKNASAVCNESICAVINSILVSLIA